MLVWVCSNGASARAERAASENEGMRTEHAGFIARWDNCHGFGAALLQGSPARASLAECAAIAMDAYWYIEHIWPGCSRQP